MGCLLDQMGLHKTVLIEGCLPPLAFVDPWLKRMHCPSCNSTFSFNLVQDCLEFFKAVSLDAMICRFPLRICHKEIGKQTNRPMVKLVELSVGTDVRLVLSYDFLIACDFLFIGGHF